MYISQPVYAVSDWVSVLGYVLLMSATLTYLGVYGKQRKGIPKNMIGSIYFNCYILWKKSSHVG